jgi:hypothetical protein
VQLSIARDRFLVICGIVESGHSRRWLEFLREVSSGNAGIVSATPGIVFILFAGDDSDIERGLKRTSAAMQGRRLTWIALPKEPIALPKEPYETTNCQAIHRHGWT